MQAGLRLCCSQTTKDVFLASRPISLEKTCPIYHENKKRIMPVRHIYNCVHPTAFGNEQTVLIHMLICINVVPFWLKPVAQMANQSSGQKERARLNCHNQISLRKAKTLWRKLLNVVPFGGKLLNVVLVQALISVQALVFDLAQLTCQKRFDCRNAILGSSAILLGTSYS